MSETQFTPGPWEVGKDGYGSDGWVYCDDVLGTAVARTDTGNGVIPKAQRDANARLIAAAPDLYEALKDASAVIEMMLRIAPDATATFGEANGIQLARAKAAAALSKVSQQQGKEK